MPSADQTKSKQLLDDLSQAVEKNLLAPEFLQLAQSGVRISGNVANSVVVSGTENVINVVLPETISGFLARVDEDELIAKAVTEYEMGLSGQQGKVSAQPYPGLLFYQLQDASHFFGREQAIAELMTILKEERVVWLHGRSGTGKSSMVQAGLMPALLKENDFPILARPFDELPTTTLKKELFRHHWSNQLNLANDSLIQFLARLHNHLGGRRMFVFFDQFEEFFIKLPEEKQRVFARELADCVTDVGLPVHFIFSLRSEYFGDTSILRERLQNGGGREYPLRPLKTEEARRVITGPLERLGISYQEGLVDIILHHLGNGDVNSPQLQLVCEKLFRALPEGGTQITTEQYKNLGETRGIISEYLKQALRNQQIIPASQQKAATYLLSTLVTPEGRRDAKRLSDWIVDTRLRSMTLAWYAERESLPLADGALSLQTIRHFAISNYIEQIAPHVTIQREDLRNLIEELSEPILEAHIRQTQKKFVGDVVNSLQQARLLHEVQTEEGGKAYELVHEYLIPEVRSWLDADEREARRLHRMLDQKQLDFELHKFILEPKELDLVNAQIENPKLEFREDDLKLILFSAVANGLGQRWLTLAGSNGLVWLRDACEQENMPESVRLGAAAYLGEVNDTLTFHRLVELISGKEKSPNQRLRLDLLAQYINRSTQNHPLPWIVRRAIFFRQASLTVREGALKRARMSRVAASVAPVCALIASVLSRTKDPVINVISAIVVVLIGTIMAIIFAQGITALALITRRWPLLWQGLIMAGVGSAIGAILFLFIANQMVVGFSGGFIALVQSFSYRGKINLSAATLTIVTAVLIFPFTMLISSQYEPLIKIGYAFSASLFACIYVYSVGKQELPL